MQDSRGPPRDLTFHHDGMFRYTDVMKERVQIQLEPDDLSALKRVAASEGRSVAAVVREATAEYLSNHEVSPEAAWERALGLAGAFKADAGDPATDVAREHDRHLADVFGE